MKTVLIFDQAESPGGSISRAVDLAEKLTNFNFIFITFHSLEYLKASTHKSHIYSYSIKSFYNDRRALKHTAWLKSKCEWKPYHSAVTACISLLMSINRKLTLWQALKVIGTKKIDLIQANCGLHSIPYKLAKKLGIPLIYYFRDLQNYQSIAPERINIAEKYVFVGRTLMEMYQHQINLPQYKCIMIHSPFDARARLKSHANPDLSLIDKLKEDQKKIIILPARITQDKGQLIALQALKRLRENISNAVLLIVGDLSKDPLDKIYYENLHSFIIENELTQNVYFLGYREDVLHLVKNADVAIHTPIYFEAMAGGIVESLQLGVPTISSDIGGAREAIEDGVTGFLFTPGDYTQLAEILVKILNGSTANLEITKRGAAHATEIWNPERIQQQMTKTYDDIISSR